jgi:dipeptidyl aminopeptidase/acylaminoacyl peptidase
MSTAFRAITVLFVLAWTLGVTPLQSVSEDDYQRLVELKTPAVSPDAAHAAVVVSRVLWNDDRRSGVLVLVDIASGTNRTLVDDLDNISDPAFSPDGTQLAFLGREEEGKDPHT